MVEAFYAQISQKIPVAPRNLAQHAKIYWMWPVYHWPNKAPVGLEDKTIVSLSWSITKVDPNSRRLLGTRRLLALPAHARLSGTTNTVSHTSLHVKKRAVSGRGFDMHVKNTTNWHRIRPVALTTRIQATRALATPTSMPKAMPKAMPKSNADLGTEQGLGVSKTITRAKSMHKIKGFNPMNIQTIPERTRHIQKPHRTMRKLLNTVRNVGVAAFRKRMSPTPSIKLHRDRHKPPLPDSKSEKGNAYHSNLIRSIRKRLTRGHSTTKTRQSPLSALSSSLTDENAKNDAKQHLSNKKIGVGMGKNVW